VQDRLKSVPRLLIPAIVLGELFVGANRSKQPVAHIGRIESLLEIATILSVDRETAEFYAVITSEQLRKGRPIPQNDARIAALSLQWTVPILTKDKHFNLLEHVAVDFLDG
jgi:tRNA(fMet)-specific endonuclease VapC